MKTFISALLLACVLMFSTGCVTGPWQLSRSWDDHYNQKYTESPWVHGVLLNNIIPFYLIVGFFASVGDMVAVNPWYFWSHDAFTSGTGFKHEPLEGATSTVGAPNW